MGTTKGRPKNNAPNPIPRASTNATKIWTFTNSIRVDHPERDAPKIAGRASAGNQDTTYSQMRAPSWMKKIRAKMAIPAPTSQEPTEDVTDSAPLRIHDESMLNSVASAVTHSFSWDSVTCRGESSRYCTKSS